MRFLIRFMEERFVEGFLNGQIYMKSNQHFIDLELENGIKGIGDKYEGGHFMNPNPEIHKVYFIADGEKIEIPYHEMTIVQQFENVKKFPILCSMLLSMEDFDFNESDDVWSLKDEVLQSFKKDFNGRTCVIIADPIEFTNRINLELDKRNLRGLTGPVTYFDLEHPLSREEFESDPRRALFYKRNFFEHQREYRLVVEHIDSDHITFDIGDITDIAFRIDSDKLGELRISKE